jgi:hypothetical protein
METATMAPVGQAGTGGVTPRLVTVTFGAESDEAASHEILDVFVDDARDHRGRSAGSAQDPEA